MRSSGSGPPPARSKGRWSVTVCEPAISPRGFAAGRGWSLDDELLTVAAILHDIGLYPVASRGGVYTADGAALARELLSSHGWSAERIERCARAIDRHHDLRNQARVRRRGRGPA